MWCLSFLFSLKKQLGSCLSTQHKVAIQALEHMSWLPYILTKTLKEKMGSLQSNEITSQQWCSWMWGACSSPWKVRNAHGFHRHHQKSHPGGTIMMPMTEWCLWSTMIGVVLREANLRWKIQYHITNYPTQVCQLWQTPFGNTKNSIILAKLPHPWQITGCLLENISSQSCHFLFFSYVYVPSIFPSWQRPNVFWEGLKIGFCSTERYLVVGQGCN